MSDLHSSSPVPRMPSRRTALVSLLAAAGAVVLPSCGGGGGGGGGVAAVDTGGTGAFSSGRISGLGSVIVNGVRFEDNAARIADDDSDKVFTRDDLRIGMVVRVQGGAIGPVGADGLPSATATTITVESQIKGPVESKGANTMVVFGQTVLVNAATAFELGVTFANITVGQTLEVHGFADANGVVTATFIEREDTPSEFKLRGFIANLNTSATTFTIGGATFKYGAGTRLPSTALANGLFVRVRTQTSKNASGQWEVNRIDERNAFENRNEAEVEGILVQSGSTFSINGLAIDFSRLPAGSVPPVGSRVEVEGSITNGVLVARKVELEDGNDNEVDVRGEVSSLNTGATTFVVRGLTFNYAGAEFRNGSAANLANGKTVRVRGTLPNGGGSTILATRVEF
jgi:hypothetical protein